MGKSWHTLSTEEVFKHFSVDPENGLSNSDAKKLLEEHGPNQLKKGKQKSPWKLFIEQFNQPLVIILLFAALGTGILQEWVDCAVIVSVVLINSIVGFLQENKALKAISSLSETLKNTVKVLRDGKKDSIDAKELVPGDVVLLDSGDKVPADLRIFTQKNLKIDEAALTGESVAADKKADETLEENTALGDRVNMAYSSTLITYGQAKGVVVETGDSTEIGKINEMIDEADVLETPLTRKITHLSKILLWAILGLAGLTFIAGWIHGQSINEMFIQAVALAVGAVPEGLPAVITVTLAIGVNKLAEKNSIIRKLPAVETLGSTTVICSDKTGTLTQNKMTVKKFWTDSGTVEISGVGYKPEGDFKNKDEEDVKIEEHELYKKILLIGLLCNDAEIKQKEGDWVINGDPTEGAMITAGRKHFKDFNENDYPRLDAIPFDSEYKYMATLNEIEGEKYILMKGSIEAILSKCKSQYTSDTETKELDSDGILEQVDVLASQGLRVLGFAMAKADDTGENIDHDDLDNKMIFVGLQALIDPPRQEAIDSIANCIKAGIKVKMITGDHVVTARAIAKELGFKEFEDGDKKEGAIKGKDLAEVPEEQWPDKANDLAVFARVSPEQKYNLVKSLQTKGHIVAMTGDGVNDAPALKQADIGIAMGITGTEVTKDSSDMVLTDDNFASIVRAIEEGRGMFDNLIKFITWILPTNLSEGLVILIAVFAGLTIPISPLQILWINMSTAVLLGMMLAFEEKEKDIMSRQPRDPDAPIIDKRTAVRILWVGLLLVGSVYYIYNSALNKDYSEAAATTAASNMLVFGELFYLFNCRSLTKSMFKIGLFTNKWIWIGVAGMTAFQMLFTYVPFMHTVFETEGYGWNLWLEILAISFVIFAIVEAEKRWLYKIIK